MFSRLSDKALILVMCGVQLLTMLSISIYAAQLPALRDFWGLNNAEAGWIGAAYFVGYTVLVPILTSLTDRIDPKRIYMVGAVLLFGGCTLFGMFATDLFTALLFHAMAGAGLAGTYMPGLKGLVDHVDDKLQSRATAFYTASFGFGAAFSYPFSDYLGQLFSWHYAFVGAGLAALISGIIVWIFLPPADPAKLNVATTRLLDFRPVFRNRAAMAYTLGYAIHCWELFGLRTWVVAYLVYAAQKHGTDPGLLGPSVIAAVLTIVGVPSSIYGNELAMKFGRRRTISLVMLASALVCFTIGLAAEYSYWLAATFCILHGVTVIMDSAALTGGALGNAEPGYRGATMAVHSTLGFAGAILGPLVFGSVLDLGGGETSLSWWMGYAHMGVLLVLGSLMLRMLRPPSIVGDRL